MKIRIIALVTEISLSSKITKTNLFLLVAKAEIISVILIYNFVIFNFLIVTF